MAEKQFILYRIYYGDVLVYLGRTKQPLQSRIHDHLFKKTMTRSLFIDQISRIEYTTFKTEADMNLYEIYFINLWKPPLNVDDKAKDELTIHLPDVEWRLFTTSLWNKWKEEIHSRDIAYDMRQEEKTAATEAISALRQRRRITVARTVDNFVDIINEMFYGTLGLSVVFFVLSCVCFEYDKVLCMSTTAVAWNCLILNIASCFSCCVYRATDPVLDVRMEEPV